MHLRELANDPVGLLQDLLCLGDRDTRQGRGHVQQVPLIDWRHELTAEPRDRDPCQPEQEYSDEKSRLAETEYDPNDGQIYCDSGTGNWVLLLRHDLPAHEIEHQDRDDRDSQNTGRTHREGLGKSQGCEEPALLGLKAEHGHERDGNDDQ